MLLRKNLGLVRRRVAGTALADDLQLFTQRMLLSRQRQKLLMPEARSFGSGREAIACTTAIFRFVMSLICLTRLIISDIFSQLSG